MAKSKKVLQNAAMLSLFPTPVVRGKIPDLTLCNRLEKAVKQLEKDREGIFEKGVFTTDDDLATKSKPFKDLSSVVLAESKQFADWLHLKRDSLYITGMWANVTTLHHRHPVHIHPNAYISGVMYVKTPEKCGNIAFVDPRAGARVFEPNYSMMNEYNSGVISYPPEKGDMFLWPSWLPHSVEKGFCDDDLEERIAIAFNVQMVGSITTRTAKLEVV